MLWKNYLCHIHVQQIYHMTFPAARNPSPKLFLFILKSFKRCIYSDSLMHLYILQF